MMMAADGWYTFTGRDGEVIPRNATRVRIDVSLTVIPANAFYMNPSIEEVECHVDVKTVEGSAFFCCLSLRRVIMPGVEVVKKEAFHFCEALTYVECDKLERIGFGAFFDCKSLRIIKLPSAKIVGWAFTGCTALTNVEFGKEMESIGGKAFYRCTSLERITIPLKDGIITENNTFKKFIPANAFYMNPSIEEVECHVDVKTVEGSAFFCCLSLRRVIMPGVEVVKKEAFHFCEALTYVECDKLERIGFGAFFDCKSLRIIKLPSAKIVGWAFTGCTALTNVEFGKEMESIEEKAFYRCTSLERITIPLKDGIITENNTFKKCENLKHVDLVGGGGVHETIAALLLEGWKNDMDREINSINQSLPTTPAGDDFNDAGGKALAIRMWIRSVLRKIIHYKAQHQSFLNEAATTLQHTLPRDIMVNNVLPFLELPSYTFEVGDHEEE
ncbi:leucine-rich repeat domain-containing protein [Skeletonema marinoi]|uniref:Leucine-rich repeat domain-containing protein n=1 Tax=Skeletonema marinoi TaxID=267567 RepID=A0AAD8XTW9_9STRA|nr:leucine-rich repeat domain-containing protein [Skeletonema marinoi]